MPARRNAPNRQAVLANRSLERGLRILRVFSPGVSVRGNSEIAELTQLPRSTVTRLTQTLVACRFLEYDRIVNAYRLGATVLGLSEAWIAGSDILSAAMPLMHETSKKLHANVTLAIADGEEMVFAHSVRTLDKGLSRRVTTGHRIPIELTSLGRAYLATLSPRNRTAVLAALKKKHSPARWKSLNADIRASMQQVAKLGYCCVDWLPGIMVAAAPIRIPGRITHVIGIGVTTQLYDEARFGQEIGAGLLSLRDRIHRAVEHNNTRNK